MIKIEHVVTETQDKFIFDTISNFAEMNYQIVVEKDELVKAIQLIRMTREFGLSIHERLATATQNAAQYRLAYDRGYEDGVKEEHDRIIDILDREAERK